MKESDPLSHGVRASLQPGRLLRLAGLGCLCACAFFAWELVPAWFSLAWESLPYSTRCSIATAFLNGLLIAYVAVLAIAILGLLIGSLLLTRGRAAIFRRPRIARLFLLWSSLVLSLGILELTAAVWTGWLHRAPAPPKPGARTADASSKLPTAFSDEKPESSAEPLRVLVIGESSGRGEPYHPWLSVGQIVGWQLERVFPDRKIEVDMWAEGGATLERMHQKLSFLNYRPDLVLLFSGHNEFQGRYAWDRNPPYYDDEQERKAVRSLVDLILRQSSICRLILETLDHQRLERIPRAVITRQLVDRPVCTESERARILSDFQSRTEAIATYCEAIGSLPVFIVPGSNDGDFEPSRSVLPPTAGRDVREAFTQSFDHARELEPGEPAQACAAYRALLKTAPGFAEAHYRLAQLLERAGEWNEAATHYVAAREADAMPMRCPEAFRRAYHDVAARHPRLILIDSTQVLKPVSPHQILDDHFYHDAQHPNLCGYLALAQETLKQMHDRHALGWPARAATPMIDADQCARHFGLNARALGDCLRALRALLRIDRVHPPRSQRAAETRERIPARGQVDHRG